jgi:hypothetical protein
MAIVSRSRPIIRSIRDIVLAIISILAVQAHITNAMDILVAIIAGGAVGNGTWHSLAIHYT